MTVKKIKEKYDLNISEAMALNDYYSDIPKPEVRINGAYVEFTSSLCYADEYLVEVVAHRYNLTEDEAYELIQKAEEE
tara:strand:- start:2078 stop:2311 length:234 start_codon:yes stop_codon:yes gene_type:complete